MEKTKRFLNPQKTLHAQLQRKMSAISFGETARLMKGFLEKMVSLTRQLILNTIKTKSICKKDWTVYLMEKIFIPKNTQFEKVKTIAGNGSQKAIRDVNRLVSLYGGNEKDWKKQSGKIKSEKYIFDIHWYEYDSNQYEVKLKYRSDSE